MMEADGATIIFIFTGVDGEVVPRDATRVIIHDSVTAIPEGAFRNHQNIVEVICHDGVEKIGVSAFNGCPRLRRVIIPGVKVIGKCAFLKCGSLTYVECDKLEEIREFAFGFCRSLPDISLPSIFHVYSCAFSTCESITKAKFGEDLDSIGHDAFSGCSSLERITVPLKDDMIAVHSFFRCRRLHHVDLVEGKELRETIASLLIDEWRDEMEAAMDSIKQIISIGDAGVVGVGIGGDIQEWITSVRLKIIRYKAQHCFLLNKATKMIEEVLPKDLVMNNIVPFLELPSHMFEGEGFDDWDWGD